MVLNMVFCFLLFVVSNVRLYITLRYYKHLSDKHYLIEQIKYRKKRERDEWNMGTGKKGRREKGGEEGKEGEGNASSMYISCNTKNTKGKPAGPLQQ